jgi:hypothetical protein
MGRQDFLELSGSIPARPFRSGWLFVDGVITLILAVMIWRTWPFSTEWALGILVGQHALQRDQSSDGRGRPIQESLLGEQETPAILTFPHGEKNQQERPNFRYCRTT